MSNSCSTGLLLLSFGCCLGARYVLAAGLARDKSRLYGSMNSVLQLVGSLRPNELIWLHAYMTGSLRLLRVSPVNRVRLHDALRQQQRLVESESESCSPIWK